MTEEVTTIRIRGDATGGVSAFEKVGAAGESAMVRIQRANTQITESTAKLAGVVTGLASSFAAAAFMNGVRTQLDLADAMDEAAQKAGVATSVFSEYAYAGRFAGLEQETLVKVFNKVNEAMVKVVTGDDDMRKLLVDTLQVEVTNAEGKLRSVDGTMMDLIDRLSGIDDQALRSAAVMELFGEKLGPQLLPLINLTRQGVENLREEARQLGVVVSDEAGAAAGDFNDNLDRLRATQEGLYNQIMTQMLPGLNTLAQLWLDNNRNAGVFKGTLVTLGQALKEAIGMGDLASGGRDAQGAANRARLIVNEIERLHAMVQKNPQATVEGGYGQGAILASERIKQLREEYDAWSRAAIAASERLKAAANARDGGPKQPKASAAEGPSAVSDAMQAKLQAEAQEKADKERKKAEREAAAEARRAKSEATREANEKRQLERQQYEDKVAGLRLQLAEFRNNTDRQLVIAEEISAAARKQFGEESQEYSRAQQDIVRIKQNAADQQRQIQDELRASQESASLFAVEAEQEAADQALALGQITQRERLALEQAFEDRLTEIKRKAMEERLAILEADPDMNPVERARIKREIEDLERASAARKQRTGNAQEREKLRPGNAGIDSFEQTFASQTARMIQGQQSAMATLQGIWSATSASFIEELVTKPLAAWLAGQARMTLATIMGVETRVATEATGAAMTESITAASSIKQIAMKAWTAAAGVYAAIAGIPYIGPFLAPVMAVGAVAAVMSFAGKMFSAEGGFDIPSGVNPLVQAHAREMILPAKYADVIRGLASGGGGGGGGGGSVAVSINALDGKSVERWLRGSGGQAIATELGLRQRSRRF